MKKLLLALCIVCLLPIQAVCLDSAFLAYNAVTDVDVMGDGSSYLVNFDSEAYDLDDEFVDDFFIAKTEGYYNFNATVLLHLGIQSTHKFATIWLVVERGDGTYSYLIPGDYTNPYAQMTSHGCVTLQVTTDVYLEVGDGVCIGITVQGGSKTIDSYGNADIYYTRFSGHIL